MKEAVRRKGGSVVMPILEQTCSLDSEMIEKLLSDGSFTTCTPRENLKPESLRRILASVGQVHTVLDERRQPRCNARVTAAYETTYGSPCTKFLAAMGYGADLERFRQDYSTFWEKNIQLTALTEETSLVVESYELVSPRRPALEV